MLNIQLSLRLVIEFKLLFAIWQWIGVYWGEGIGKGSFFPFYFCICICFMSYGSGIIYTWGTGSGSLNSFHMFTYAVKTFFRSN